MNRGIRFILPNERNNFLSKIIKNIPSKQYYWFNFEQYDQVFDENNEFFFHKDSYVGEEFVQLVSNSVYYIVSVKLQAYFFDKDIYEIKNYADFQRSNCQLVIRIVDNIFVNIYTKDETILKTLKNNAVMNSFSSIEFITETNDMLWNE